MIEIAYSAKLKSEIKNMFGRSLSGRAPDALAFFYHMTLKLKEADILNIDTASHVWGGAGLTPRQAALTWIQLLLTASKAYLLKDYSAERLRMVQAAIADIEKVLMHETVCSTQRGRLKVWLQKREQSRAA